MPDMFGRFSLSLFVAIAGGVFYILAKAYNARKIVYKLRRQGLPMPPFSWATGHMLAMKPFMEKLPADAITNYTVTELAYSLNKEAFYLDFWPLSEPLLILTTPDMASQLTQQFNPLKPSVIENAFAGLTGGPNLFTMPDVPWKRWRAIFNPGFSPSYMLQQTPKIVDECRVFCEKMRARVRQNQMFYLEEDTLRLTLDVIGVVTLDTHFRYQEFTSWIPESLRALIEWTSFGTELNPFNRWNPMRPYKLWYHGRKINKYIEAELDKRFVERRYSNDSKRDTRSVKSIVALALDSYMAEENASGASSDATTLDETFKHYACAQIRLFLFAGHDTTSSTMVYAFHLLATNPDCLTRIRAEHDQVFGAGTSPDRVGDLLSADPNLLNQLTYTTACIKEALRLFPPASAMRVGGPDTVLVGSDGTRYPTAGCSVWGIHLAIQRNPAVFPQPNRFIPDRWLPMTLPGDPLHPAKGAWRPFEFGPRNCVGQTLAMAEIKILLAMTTRAFDFRPAYDEWDRLHPPGHLGGAGAIRTALGDRAYQVEGGGGGAHAANKYPCRVRMVGDGEKA
ncbi:cytochrome p450 [Diplodia corticola]|uniref:Cytochrome p450 n=1 Tax=Diplodia corticola TaxID=236234 RepID=A0A1J9RL27_9PEZI|nr:cytochrome p450 [Diplodia corticola]OJD40674.1 cytochrome p450 [Diplodia corticola]